jgi:prepilin-type N-terminal cleavage/methylation domain-containing protein
MTTIELMKKGFTLVELLVVIAIIAILAAVLVLLINPLDLTRRGRDAVRLTDLASLNQAINASVAQSTASGTVAALCKDSAYPCSGSSNTGTRSVDGTGWVKADLTAQRAVTLATLPVDAVNTPALHMTYCANDDSWELNVALESDSLKNKASTDGGNDPNLYEIGSNLQLISPSGGSCNY